MVRMTPDRRLVEELRAVSVVHGSTTESDYVYHMFLVNLDNLEVLIVFHSDTTRPSECELNNKYNYLVFEHIGESLNIKFVNSLSFDLFSLYYLMIRELEGKRPDRVRHRVRPYWYNFRRLFVHKDCELLNAFRSFAKDFPQDRMDMEMTPMLLKMLYAIGRDDLATALALKYLSKQT